MAADNFLKQQKNEPFKFNSDFDPGRASTGGQHEPWIKQENDIIHQILMQYMKAPDV